MQPAGPSQWSAWIARHREIRTLTQWYVLPSTGDGRRRCWVVRTLLLLGPIASVLGAAALIVAACVAASAPAILAAVVLTPIVLAGGIWRSSSSLTLAGCALTLAGIAVLWKDVVDGWPRVPLGAVLFASAFVLAAVAIFQALREPAVATWANSDLEADGVAQRDSA
jgi:hypothetical protein